MLSIDLPSHPSRYLSLLCALLLALVGHHASAQTNQLAAGAEHTCAVTASGSVKCWGNNATGQLGNGSFSSSPLPTLVLGFDVQVRAVAAGAGHSCALTVIGSVKCWGNNGWGQLGNNSTDASSNTPVDVVGLSSGVTGISANGYFTCVIQGNSGVKCWGNNRAGQLGSGDSVYASRVPMAVLGLPAGVTQVALGEIHACALTAIGAIKCWGDNFDGQLGSSVRSSLTPLDVVGASSGMVKVSAGMEHTCAVSLSGAAKYWGRNQGGQIGDGTGVSRYSAVNVIGLASGVTEIAVGGSHSCASLASGGVKCWGYVYGGGDSANTPVAVPELDQGIRSLAAGYQHTCAIRADSTIKCWGFNNYGVLGDGTENNFRTVPVAVVGFANAGSTVTTKTMVEYRYSPLDYDFITSRDSDKTALDSVANWQRTGKSFSVLANNDSGSSPITRFYFDQVAKNKSRGSHFYTLLPSEVAAVQALNPSNLPAPGKPVNEGIDSYAYLPSASGTCATGLLPVYRLFRGNARFPDDANHRFTTDLADYNDFVGRGWDGEGVKFCVPQ